MLHLHFMKKGYTIRVKERFGISSFTFPRKNLGISFFAASSKLEDQIHIYISLHLIYRVSIVIYVFLLITKAFVQAQFAEQAATESQVSRALLALIESQATLKRPLGVCRFVVRL